MRNILHIITAPNCDDLRPIMDGQGMGADVKVEIVDLTGGPPNYDDLLEKICSADSVQVW